MLGVFVLVPQGIIPFLFIACDFTILIMDFNCSIGNLSLTAQQTALMRNDRCPNYKYQVEN